MLKYKDLDLKNMLLKKNHQYFEKIRPNRLIFEENKAAEIKLQPDLLQPQSESEKENLKNISEVVKVSYLERQKLSKDIDKITNDISEAMKLHKDIVKKLLARINNGEL